jgi:hypothetical protein
LRLPALMRGERNIVAALRIECTEPIDVTLFG